MGLLRSGLADFSLDEGDEALTEPVWKITEEIIKTAVENGQNLIVEGCYVPLDWQKDFEERYRAKIGFLCLAFDEKYIEKHYQTILQNASCIEKRTADDSCTVPLLQRENRRFSEGFRQKNLPVLCIRENYEEEIRKAEDFYFSCE